MHINWLYVGIAAAVLWVAYSPDPLAEVIRVAVFHAKSRLARKLDSAIARHELAVANAERAKAEANQQLLIMKDARNDLKLQLDPLDALIAARDTAAKNAASVGKDDMVKQALQEKRDAEDDAAPIREQYQTACTRIDYYTKRSAALDVEIKQRRAALADAKSRSAGASSAEIDTIIARLDSAGNQANMQKADDLLREAEAHAMTMRGEADQALATRRQKAEMDAMSQPQGRPSIDDEAAALMAQFNKSKS